LPSNEIFFDIADDSGGYTMIFTVFWIAGLLAGGLTSVFVLHDNSLSAVCSNLLFYQMTVTVFLSGLTGFIGHVFKSDKIARSIGWATGSPFQKELGFAELGYALAGFFCIFYGREFRLAVIVLVSPLYLLAGLIHIYEMVAKHNFASHNTLTIIPDLLMPVSWIVLYLLS
jgi:hypothetical protein